MLVEVFFPPEGTCRLVHIVEARATTLEDALDWTWRYANIVHQGDPWVKTGLRSAMVGDVFFANGEAHAVMMMGHERFGFQRDRTRSSFAGDKSRRRGAAEGEGRLS